jgi:hypothetical protein
MPICVQSSITILSMGHIWTIVATCLQPAEHHVSEPEVFLKIVAVLTALLRTQRHLVANALPLLSHVMGGLLLSLRSVRPLLGMRQRRIISSAHPFWVTLEDPLGAQHAAELARLFCTLEVKTPARGHHRTAQSKLESLAKPFARHAASLLQKYIDMTTDSFALVTTEVRRSLQPGMFALCGMITEQDRDSLMRSLGRPSSKALLRSLWQEYERQRYVGKG